MQRKINSTPKAKMKRLQMLGTYVKNKQAPSLIKVTNYSPTPPEKTLPKTERLAFFDDFKDFLE